MNSHTQFRSNPSAMPDGGWDRGTLVCDRPNGMALSLYQRCPDLRSHQTGRLTLLWPRQIRAELAIRHLLSRYRSHSSQVRLRLAIWQARACHAVKTHIP